MLQKSDRARLPSGPGGLLLDGLIDVMLTDRTADSRVDVGGEFSGGSHPIAKRDGH